MTRDQSWEYREKAQEAREAGEYLMAGDYHSQAAFELVGSGVFNASNGAELQEFLEACTCYRVAGADNRCQRRAQMGVLRAEELAEQAFAPPEPSHAFDRAQRGVWYEYIGDFHSVGDLGNADHWYEQAKATYRDAGDPTTGNKEQPHMYIMSYFQSVAQAAGADMDALYETTAHQPLSEWVEYKQERLPRYLETLTEQGSFPI